MRENHHDHVGLSYLKNAGLNVGLAGNRTESGIAGYNDSFDYYVVELSSFQLDGMTEFKADIAILLNITPDHLDEGTIIFRIM